MFVRLTKLLKYETIFNSGVKVFIYFFEKRLIFFKTPPLNNPIKFYSLLYKNYFLLRTKSYIAYE